MKNKIQLSLIPYIVMLMFVLVMIGGWVANIVKLISGQYDSFVTTEFILRVIGVFVGPFGSIMGFI